MSALPACTLLTTQSARSFGTAAARPARSLKLNLPADLLPQKVAGKWRAARVSARQAATLRKAAMADGTYGSYDSSTGMYRANELLG